MKKLSNLLAALVFGSLVIFMSCGGGADDPVPTAEELQAALLTTGSWPVNASSVTYGGTPEGDWTGFTITLTGNADGDGTGGYTTSNTPEGYEDVMPANGNWSFKDGTSGKTIIRTGGGAGDVEMSITVNDASLSLTFTVDDPAGRTSGLYGEPWIFSFSK